MRNWLINFVSNISKFMLDGEVESTDPDYNASVSPIYDFLDTFGPFLITLIMGLGVIYCIVLMVKFVKEDDAGERDKVKKQAINAVISFGVVAILIVLLYAFRGVFIKAMNDTQ